MQHANSRFTDLVTPSLFLLHKGWLWPIRTGQLAKHMPPNQANQDPITL